MTQRVENIGKAYNDTIWHAPILLLEVASPLLDGVRYYAAFLDTRTNHGVHVPLHAIHNAGHPTNHRTAI